MRPYAHPHVDTHGHSQVREEMEIGQQDVIACTAAVGRRKVQLFLVVDPHYILLVERHRSKLGWAIVQVHACAWACTWEWCMFFPLSSNMRVLVMCECVCAVMMGMRGSVYVSIATYADVCVGVILEGACAATRCWRGRRWVLAWLSSVFFSTPILAHVYVCTNTPAHMMHVHLHRWCTLCGTKRHS